MQSGFSLEGYAYYIAGERRAKKVDTFVLATLYERAIAEADKRRFAGEPNAEDALRTFWHGYLDTLVSVLRVYMIILFTLCREWSTQMTRLKEKSSNVVLEAYLDLENSGPGTCVFLYASL